MDEILSSFENLKISAFSKYSKLTGDINNVTIGPNSTILHDANEEEQKTPEPQKRQNLIEDKSPRSPPPLNQVLHVIETQRREKLQETIDDHYNKFEKFSKSRKEEKENQWYFKQQEFIQSMHDTEQMILQMLNQSDANKSKQNENLIKHYQDMAQRKMQYEQQLEKTKEKQRILNEHIEKIKKCQLEFRSVYQEIITIIKTCPSSDELKKSLGDSFKLLKILPESLDEVVAKCRNYNVDEEQFLRAVSIVNQVKNLKHEIEETVSRINHKKVEEPDKAAPLAQSTPVKVDPKTPVEKNDSIRTITDCVSVTNLKKYAEIKQFLSNHSQLYKDLLAEEQLKQFRFDCKKAINIPVNALSAVNSDHLRDKYVKLNNLLSGKTVIVADRQVNALKHPQGIPFCMDLLARKFVLQGDLMISSNPEAAFCYATIIVSLWNDFPDFGKLLLGYFYTECPYLVPFYIPKTEEQTTEEYYQVLGYHYIDGQIEKQDKFLKRMTGILRLYFAIFIAKPKRGQTKNPYDITNAWIFLASILKLKPQLDITATVLHVFLETVGFEMELVYGMAFKKLVVIIMEKFMPTLKKIDSGGPVTRLEVLLQDYKSKGHFETPNGILPNNFW
ncbi:mRNA export factor Gle1 [Tribolium castaneum]|uniref:mRNA export factor GLE1 n=1 Tax=Tribolium castaneum TaxID=7070 RepID=D6WQJ6_TRICA|nr:PREDICTED: nucleoporin GLE1 [Tribolium castaneum]XP_974896.1 PREDICTED: nucleoporin GLE1 [Tribolium castaneum]EFA06063.1 Nucleoporin GLE1-like Protein [Tribolium castaneum]|eukprot:XP_008195850.1 PREDICTED: nucleoporin GLE1 [Tribolium castaneum]